MQRNGHFIKVVATGALRGAVPGCVAYYWRDAFEEALDVQADNEHAIGECRDAQPCVRRGARASARRKIRLSNTNVRWTLGKDATSIPGRPNARSYNFSKSIGGSDSLEAMVATYLPW